MLTNLAFFRAKQGQTKSLGKALTDLVDPSRQEDGCISYDVHQSLQDADSWFVYENWRTTADLDAHMQKPHTAYGFARAVEEGASEAGADVRLRKVRELAPEEAIASNQGWAAHRLDSQRQAFRPGKSRGQGRRRARAKNGHAEQSFEWVYIRGHRCGIQCGRELGRIKCD